MSVEFEVDQQKFKSKTAFGRKGTTGIAGWLIEKGIVKDETQASSLLTIIVALNLILTGVIIYYFLI